MVYRSQSPGPVFHRRVTSHAQVHRPTSHVPIHPHTSYVPVHRPGY